MELVIYKPTEQEFIQSIDFNYDDLKKQLGEALSKYEGLVYSESNIREAKTDRAKLNKFKDALETRRKEIKKACMAPYDAFEVKVKDLVAMVDKPILAIDTQVKAYEQVLKDEKLEGIKSFYADRVGELKDLVPFDRINNPRWMNVTYKEADIHKEIMDTFIKVESDLKVITEINSEYELQIKDTYLKNFDLTAALQEKTRLEEQAAKLAEFKKNQAEKEAALKASLEGKKFQKRSQTAEVSPESHPEANQEAKAEATLYTLDFRARGTRDQLMSVKKFMDDNGIKYGAVPKDEGRAS